VALREELLTLEKRFWTGDATYYRQNLDDSCMIAFTEMTGVFEKDDIAATIKSGSRWRNVAISLKGILGPAPGIALITYHADATRESGEPYAALVSSGYVRRDGTWKLAFHQHTPLASQGK
jgi:hypothetical protein